MTQFSLRTLPVAVLMTTAMSWGLPLHAADLEAEVKPKSSFSIGPGGGNAKAASTTQASAKEKEPKVAPVTSQKGAQLDNPGRSAAALSAVTAGKALDGQAAMGATVRGAVATDGQAQAPGRTPSQ